VILDLQPARSGFGVRYEENRRAIALGLESVY
jgi:hypothetical protein